MMCLVEMYVTCCGRMDELTIVGCWRKTGETSLKVRRIRTLKCGWASSYFSDMQGGGGDRSDWCSISPLMTIIKVTQLS